jgi:hypothetical protein
MLQAAADAIATGKDARPAGLIVHTAANSERRWIEYSRIKAKPIEARSEDEAMRLRVYEASPAFRVRMTFGAVA